MGLFNKAFRILCDEILYVSSRDFAVAWNDELGGTSERIDESTINRWKKGTLPRPYYLPRIVTVFAGIDSAHSAAGFPQRLDEGAKARLRAACVELAGGDAAVRAPVAGADSAAFLAGILEFAYCAQKDAGKGGHEAAEDGGLSAETAPIASPRSAIARKRLSIPATGLVSALALGMLLLAVLGLSGQRTGGAAPSPAGADRSGDAGGAPVIRAIEAGAETQARRLLATGESVDVAHFKGNAAKIGALARACQGPISPLASTGRIDAAAGGWGVFWGDDLPRFSMGPSAPNGEAGSGGGVLRLSLLGGDPYAFAHFYANLADRPARRFTFSMRFYIGGATTFDNEKEASTVQALEFSLSKYAARRRSEIAWQWENVGDGAPQWRFWDPAKGWVRTDMAARISPRAWHELRFSGSVDGDSVRYESLSLDGEDAPVRLSVPTAAAPDASDYLAVAVQLDGNFRSDPYDLYIRDLSLQTER
jgi:hypothetical protein